MSLTDDLETLHYSVDNSRVDQDLLDALNQMADNIRDDQHEGACWDIVRDFIILADYYEKLL